VIIGVGNPDRGDDAAGRLAARRLRSLGLDAVVEHSGEGTALLEAWSGAGRVILIDAVVTGAPPGTITVWEARKAPLQRTSFRGSTHAFGVAEAVELARALDRLPASLTIYGIEAQQFQPGAGLSPAVSDAVGQLAERIAQEVARCTNPA
jgi:hydrogenase maturation protease